MRALRAALTGVAGDAPSYKRARKRRPAQYEQFKRDLLSANETVARLGEDFALRHFGKHRTISLADTRSPLCAVAARMELRKQTSL